MVIRFFFMRSIFTYVMLLFFLGTLFPIFGDPKTNVMDDLQPKISSDGQAGFTIKSDKTIVSVGDTVTLTLEITLPEGYDKTKEIKITGVDDYTLLSFDSKTNTVKILVDKIPFELGPFDLIFMKDNEKNLIHSNSLKLNLQSHIQGDPLKADPEKLYEIIPVFSSWPKYLFWISVIVLPLLFIAGLLYWFFFKKKELHTLDERPAHEIARSELEALRIRLASAPRATPDVLHDSDADTQTNKYTKHFAKEFHFRFSEILRSYIESIKQFPARESTIEEISRKLKGVEDRDVVLLMQYSDRVKFADENPDISRYANDIDHALRYIEKTTPDEPLQTASIQNGDSLPKNHKTGKISVYTQKVKDFFFSLRGKK